jgi:hypothetical protein
MPPVFIVGWLGLGRSFSTQQRPEAIQQDVGLDKVGLKRDALHPVDEPGIWQSMMSMIKVKKGVSADGGSGRNSKMAFP